MQLDQTHVVVRVRSFSEIGDLAMVMLRRYPTAILVGFALGALPWLIANALLLSWIPWAESEFGFGDAEGRFELSRYLIWMTVLVALQAPLAGIFTTHYLGQAVFEQQPTWNSVIREVRRQLVRCLWVLGVLRLPLPAMVIVALRWGQPADWLADVFLPIVLLLAAAFIRGSRPFMPEILLLEQCPLRSRDKAEITVVRRSRALHSPMAGELAARFAAVAFVLLFVMLCVYYTIYWGRGIALGTWRTDLLALLIFYPLALWVTAGLSVIIRLLNYLDARIRLEGWEVELSLRAEALRQFGEDATTGLTPSVAEGTA